MKKLTILGMTAVTGVALAASVVAPAYAWNPEGKITKYVTNVTASGAMSDANDANTAVSAKPGDVLKYTIVIANPAQAAGDGHNDLASVKMEDTLPAGVELTSDASKRVIKEELGTILPGKSVTKEYTVKVTATEDKKVITNKACFTGNSKVNDAPRNGCDNAVVKITVPPVVTPPVVTPPVVTPPTTTTPIGKGSVETPAVLPATGPASLITIVATASVAGYAANLLRLRFAGRRG